jgi:hypothetical protein
MNNRRTGIFDFLNEGSSGSSSGGSSSTGSRTQIFNMISDYNNNMRRMIYLLENAEQRESRIMVDVMPLLSSSLSSLTSMFDSSLSLLPTAQQISENTTRSNYVVLDISGNELPICPITMETIQIGDPVLRINRCGHLFKESALRTWLERDGRCPVCRGGV